MCQICRAKFLTLIVSLARLKGAQRAESCFWLRQAKMNSALRDGRVDKEVFYPAWRPSIKILRSCDFFFFFFFTFKISLSVQHTFTFSLMDFKTLIAFTIKSIPVFHHVNYTHKPGLGSHRVLDSTWLVRSYFSLTIA